MTISTALHIKSSIISGRNIAAAATVPYIPTDDFNSPIEAVTVFTASESAVPATGTAVPRINFAVLTVRLSAAEFTAV